MIDFLGSLWWMIVALGVLVTFHEFGHYWVARRCGVRVLKFSVGFGKTLFSRYDRHGTEFAISAIPLGGYVKMLDENASDSPIPTGQLHESFNRKPVLQRMAIVAAGPAANLLLCVLFLWTMLIIGKQDWSATLGQIQGIAAQAGFERGERIVEVDGRKTATWGEASLALTAAAIDQDDVPVTVEDSAGHSTRRTLPLSLLPKGFDQENVVALAGLGWAFQSVPAHVGEVVAGGPADGLLQPGDQIVAVNGRAVHDLGELREQVARLGERGGSGMVEVDRAGERFAFELTPQRLKQADGSPYWALGIAAAATAMPEPDALLRHGPLAAIPMAVRETWQMASDSLGMIRRMLVGDASVKNISGPITIARAANSSAKRGTAWFLWFLAAVSLSLAIVNLLPIPVLDGGHLLYYLIELLKGSPLSDRSMQAGQYLGLLMLAGLMGLAFYNDIFRLVAG